jgi:hypothetical protein
VIRSLLQKAKGLSRLLGHGITSPNKKAAKGVKKSLGGFLVSLPSGNFSPSLLQKARVMMMVDLETGLKNSISE